MEARGDAVNRRVVVAVLGAALFATSSVPVHGGTLSADVDGVRIEVTSKPERARTHGETEYIARLVDVDGKPITGARVALQGRMGDGMTVVAPLRAASEPGIYRGRVLFTMEGRWELTLRIARGSKRFDVPLTERVER
jgi:hypothetical protein